MKPFGNLSEKVTAIRAEAALANSSRTLADAENEKSQAKSDTCENFSNFSRFSRAAGESAGARSSTSETIERKKVFINNINSLAEVEALAETDRSDVHTHGAAKPAKAAKVELSLSDYSISTLAGSGESAAKAVDRWRSSFAELSLDRSPIAGVRQWTRIYSNMRRFLDSHAETAAALAWDEVELFGVHPELGIRQVRYCGLLLLTVCKPVTCVEPDRIATANGLVWRRGSVASGSVSIFDMTKLHKARTA